MKPGDPLPVVSTKYDGSAHYRYTLTVVTVQPGRLTAWGPAGTPLDGYRGPYPAWGHFLMVHFTDRDWNLEVMWEPDWRPREHYVNIALPSTWDDGTLRFVDLDLDIVWRPNGALELHDEDEFAAHRVRFGYPAEVVDRVWRAVDEVNDLITRRAPPFDGTLYEWRPMSSSSGPGSPG